MVQDPRLPQLLEALRASGRKLFLATNSLWDYTHVVMNFLLAGRTGSQKNMDWLEYFDAVITGRAESGLLKGVYCLLLDCTADFWTESVPQRCHCSHRLQPDGRTVMLSGQVQHI